MRTLFDAKAAGWPAKYAPDGRLAGRLTQLAAAAADLAAAGGELLDLGCGSGELARHLAAAGYQVTGCDIAPPMLRQAAVADPAHAVPWVRLEPGWRTLPFAAGSLDAVVAASVPGVRARPSRGPRRVRPGAAAGRCPAVHRAQRGPSGALAGMAAVPGRADRLADRTRPDHGEARRAGPGSYLAYLRTSRQRRRVRWWLAAARQAGCRPVRRRVGATAREHRAPGRTARAAAPARLYPPGGSTGRQAQHHRGDSSDDRR